MSGSAPDALTLTQIDHGGTTTTAAQMPIEVNTGEVSITAPTGRGSPAPVRGKGVAPEQHADTFSVLEQMADAHPAYPHRYLPWAGAWPPLTLMLRPAG